MQSRGARYLLEIATTTLKYNHSSVLPRDEQLPKFYGRPSAPAPTIPGTK